MKHDLHDLIILVKCKYNNFPTVKTWSIWGKIKFYCFRIHFWVQQTCHKSEVVNLMIINDDAKPKRRRFKCCVVFTWQWCMSNLLYEFCDVSNLNVFVVSRQDVTKYFNCIFATGPFDCSLTHIPRGKNVYFPYIYNLQKRFLEIIFYSKDKCQATMIYIKGN